MINWNDTHERFQSLRKLDKKTIDLLVTDWLEKYRDKEFVPDAVSFTLKYHDHSHARIYASDAAYYTKDPEYTYATYLRAVEPSNPYFEDKWVSSTVKSLLNKNDYDLMPIVADALEDSGCTNIDLLTYLRSNKIWTKADYWLRKLS